MQASHKDEAACEEDEDENVSERAKAPMALQDTDAAVSLCLRILQVLR